MNCTLSEALDIVFGHNDWSNPLHPMISGISQTPYEAYSRLKTEYQEIVERLIGHIPTKDEV